MCNNIVEELDKNFLNFGSKCASLNLTSKLSVNTYIENYKSITEGKFKYQSMWLAQDTIDLTRDDIYSIAIGVVEVADENMKSQLKENLNELHRWLLVSAFEYYERFITYHYAYLGFHDKNLWKASDFGNIHISEIDKQEFQFFLGQSRKRVRKEGPYEILKDLKKIISSIEDREENNPHIPQIGIWIRIIETFRHIIIHSDGIIEEDQFWELLKKSTGLAMNVGSGIRNEVEELIYRNDMNALKVWLLGKISPVTIPTERIANPFIRLFRIIILYSALIYACSLKEIFKIEPFWSRE